MKLLSRALAVAAATVVVATSLIAVPAAVAGPNDPTDAQYSRMFLTPKNLPFKNVAGTYPVANYFTVGPRPEPPLFLEQNWPVPQPYQFSLQVGWMPEESWWVVGTNDGRSGLVQLSHQTTFGKYANELRERGMYGDKAYNYMGRHPKLGLRAPGGLEITLYPCQVKKKIKVCYPANAHTYRITPYGGQHLTELPLNMGYITVAPHSK